MEYSYIAYTKDNRVISGSVVAAGEYAAGEHLAKLGYSVLSLKKAKPFQIGLGKIFSSSSSKVKNETIVTFSRQMATLMNAGVNIVTSLELLEAQGTNKTFKSVLTAVISDLRKGVGLSDAMSLHPVVFSALYCRSLKVGEQTGDLSRVLNQIADYMEKGISAKKSVKGALGYPIFMLLVTLVVIFVLINFVFPTFIGLYKTMGAELPALTILMLMIVNLMKIVGPVLLGVIGVCAVGILIYTRKPQGRYNWDKFLLKIPKLGYIILLQELAISCRTISILFRSGLPLAEILDVLIDSSSNRVITKSWTDIKTSVFKGEGLSGPMARNPVFLPMMVEMIKVGEETGEMDTTMIAVAQNYDAEADNRTKAFIGVIQPAMTIIIGGVVFIVVLSMMSLMYSIYGQM